MYYNAIVMLADEKLIIVTEKSSKKEVTSFPVKKIPKLFHYKKEA